MSCNRAWEAVECSLCSSWYEMSVFSNISSQRFWRRELVRSSLDETESCAEIICRMIDKTFACQHTSLWTMRNGNGEEMIGRIYSSLKHILRYYTINFGNKSMKTKILCYIIQKTRWKNMIFKWLKESEIRRSDDHVKLSENKKSLLYGIYYTVVGRHVIDEKWNSIIYGWWY